jgi:hypothetical protein
MLNRANRHALEVTLVVERAESARKVTQLVVVHGQIHTRNKGDVSGVRDAEPIAEGRALSVAPDSRRAIAKPTASTRRERRLEARHGLVDLEVAVAADYNRASARSGSNGGCAGTSGIGRANLVA